MSGVTPAWRIQARLMLAVAVSLMAALSRSAAVRRRFCLVLAATPGPEVMVCWVQQAGGHRGEHAGQGGGRVVAAVGDGDPAGELGHGLAVVVFGHDRRR